MLKLFVYANMNLLKKRSKRSLGGTPREYSLPAEKQRQVKGTNASTAAQNTYIYCLGLQPCSVMQITTVTCLVQV